MLIIDIPISLVSITAIFCGSRWWGLLNFHALISLLEIFYFANIAARFLELLLYLVGAKSDIYFQ